MYMHVRTHERMHTGIHAHTHSIHTCTHTRTCTRYKSGGLASKLALGGVFRLRANQPVLSLTETLEVTAGTYTCIQARMQACMNKFKHACPYTSCSTPAAHARLLHVGSIVLFDGGGKTIKTGSWGFHIEANAKLCLYNVNLIDGTVCSLCLHP